MSVLLRLLPLIMPSLSVAYPGADSLLRREGKGQSSEVVGNVVEIREHVHRDIHARTVKKGLRYHFCKKKTTPEPNLVTCLDYHINNADGTDTCEAGDPSYDQEKCRDAADALNLTKGVPFMKNNSNDSVIPHPKLCFADTSVDPYVVYFNPDGADNTGVTLTGKKICERALYVNGTENKDATNACPGAGPDYVPILEYDACLFAMTSCAGGGAPKLEPFFLNVTPANYKPANKPSGCFQEKSTGKWGFNWIHKEGGTVDETLVNDSQSICYDSTAFSEGNLAPPTANTALT